MIPNLRIAYAGTPEFAVPALKALEASQHEVVAVLTQPDRKSGRGRKISKSAVKQAITSSNVLLMQPDDVNDDETLEALFQLNLDVIVVAAYGQLFSQRLLNLPRLGCINIHASLLPRWRGASPIQHAILSGDKESGVTIMQMTRAMDAGDIWQQSKCLIDECDSSESLHDKLAQLGGVTITEALAKIVSGQETPLAQDQSRVTYCTKLNKKDGLIDWLEPADVIIRKIRAFYPWPGSYTFYAGRRLRITQAQVSKEVIEDSNLPPGIVCGISTQGFTVLTGDGSGILITELVPEGGKKVSAVDFSHSNILDGRRLGGDTDG